ncbi:DUF3618 domain-containing protein [Streptomyces sp. NPDC048258]|uniref:DUF3618 domain-containing protein n=1 Tax=Streptomyces sp. NPDC048258 TaxID=3365527 RepID=UPI00371CEB3D
MSRTSRESGSQPANERLREQVEDDRAELGRTVQALAAKADIKGQAREKAAAATHQAREKAVAATHHVGRTASRTVRRDRWLLTAGAACLVWLVARQVAARRHR